MKTSKIITSILATAMLSAVAATATACGPSWRNKFAYDLDWSADVRGTTIEFWTGFGSDNNDIMLEAIGEFEKMTGVRVMYESKGSYDGVLQATQLAATTGKFPHLVVGYPDHFASYVNQDIIVRLNYYFENDVHDVFEPEGEDFEIADFYEDYMRENQSIEFDAEGNPYTLGVPFNKSTETLVYNSTFFDWCALQDDLKNDIYVPRTWAEINSVGKAILDMLDAKGVYDKYLLVDGAVSTTMPSDKNQVVLNLKGITKWNDSSISHKQEFKPFSYDSQANLFITSVRQNGGEYTYYDKEARHGYIGFNNQTTINVLNTLKGYYDNHTFGIPADWDEAKYGSNPFKAQKTVMTLGSSAGVSNDSPTGDAFKIKAAPVPYFNADKKYVISQGANLALLDKGSREQRLAAWKLLKFLTKYANGYVCSQMGYYPASPYAENGGSWEGVEEEDFPDYHTWYLDSLDSANMTESIKAQTAGINYDYYVKDTEHWTKFVDQPFPGSAAIRLGVANIPKYVLIDKMTPQAAINKALESLRDYIPS